MNKDPSGKPPADKQRSAETRSNKAIPSMEEKESSHPLDVLHHGSSSEKARIRNTAGSEKKAGLPAPIPIF